MLNLSYTLTIGSALLLLISGIALGQWDSGIRRCERVKGPYVKKCTLPIHCPEVSPATTSLAPSSTFAVL